MAQLLPISAVVPTLNRRKAFSRMLASLAEQSSQPAEIIVVDASTGEDTRMVCQAERIAGLDAEIKWFKAETPGAATQRNQGIKVASQEAILFIDDDVLFEPECIARLWESLNNCSKLGGVSSMIVNQRYQPPGLGSRLLFRALNGRAESSYAGKCIGPALNLLPEDSPDLPETVPVEWLNTTCTLYREQALPDPPFTDHFTGYSFMEDVALSLTVGRQWKLANARTARIYHDSQSADYKENKLALARMQLINRHFVMARVLGRKRLLDYAKLALLESFEIATALTQLSAWRTLPTVLFGKLSAIRAIIQNSRKNLDRTLLTDNRNQFISS